MKSSTGRLIHQDTVITKFFESYDYLNDKNYTVWEHTIYDKKFTFEKTLEFCGVNWEFNKEKTKEKWLKYVREWNMIRNKKEKQGSDYDTIGYVAITYLYVSLDYSELPRTEERSSYITEFQAKLINICKLHETGKTLDCFTDYDMLTISDPPYDPIEYELFLHEQYNSASWFLSFLIYLKTVNIKLDHQGALWT
jgi:hypothetical protein